MNAEVLALDSMTLYRGMDVGTAKPTFGERQGVPHHLIDVLDPWESASVADYRAWAISQVLDVESRGKVALFVGGTPMYLKVLLRGLFEGPPADETLRNRLETESSESLHARLFGYDPTLAARLHVNDRRRVIRAIEVRELTGKPLSEHQQEHDQPALGVKVFALERPRDLLFINGLTRWSRPHVSRWPDRRGPPPPIRTQTALASGRAGVGYRGNDRLFKRIV